MINKDIGLIEYSRRVDAGNCITHAIAAVLSVPALIMLVLKADGLRHTLSAVIFGRVKNEEAALLAYIKSN